MIRFEPLLLNFAAIFIILSPFSLAPALFLLLQECLDPVPQVLVRVLFHGRGFHEASDLCSLCCVFWHPYAFQCQKLTQTS